MNRQNDLGLVAAPQRLGFPLGESRFLFNLRKLTLEFLWLAAVLAALPLTARPASLQITELRCEYRQEPLGLDEVHPRLSWILEPTRRARRGQRQTAFEVLVATTPALLRAGAADLWDSGRVNSDQSIQVRYGGAELRSSQQCYWSVRVWDEAGRPTGWSPPAHWSMGLLGQADWRGKWIGLDGPEPENTLHGTFWVWFPEGHPEVSAPIGTRFFRRSFELPPGRKPKSARWLVTGDNEFRAFVNGTEVGSGNNFSAALGLDVLSRLHPGKNLLGAAVKNVGSTPNPAGFVGLLQVEFEAGEPLLVPTDDTWRTSAEKLADWEKPDYDDSTWLAARKLGPVGMMPWGQIGGPEARRLAARWLRKEFGVAKGLRRATAYIAGVGLSELYLNGEKAGDAVLSPGLTDYNKRVFYVTYDVTRQVHLGKNAMGVVLGNGRFFAPRGKIPTATRTFGFPKLLLQLRLEYDDGSVKWVVSDSSWQVTADGPIRANNEYDGEEYDARLEMPGWNRVGFDDADWSNAPLVSAPQGELTAQSLEPIRVTQTVRPLSMTQIQPGVWIFDMGQNLVGWCRLRVSGPRGTVVRLRHAETLGPDGGLYVANLRSAKATDTYTLKGQGREVYEPRFTYHGFRYVEVTGFPGRPRLENLEARVVQDDLESTGDFTCADELLNRIYRNIRWGVRGNYRSIPTDCPQRDERQGWLGDRSAESKGETYLFNTAALYGKWLQDMADGQKDDGSVPDVCPAYWPFYSDNVTWPSSTVLIPEALLEQFGDSEVVARHYPSAKRWMDHMSGFVTNGLISRDSYGDWCVPPDDPKQIHSDDPKKKTNPGLLASAYFYEDAVLMAGYARQLGKAEDAGHFEHLAETLKATFNSSFLDEEHGQYDNGSQTSCVLPLAFGLVPESQRGRVFQHLLDKLEQESHGHIGTGLIGGQWLMRVLSDNGRADVALQLATQRTYPSWGYMVQKGATTIWELWNGDTADPAMNSGNHVMLVGDLGVWLFEYLAGIRPDPSQPGFKHIVLRPETACGLAWVRATHSSPYGLIASEWKKDGAKLHWHIRVPVNTTATICVPASSAATVFESGRSAQRARGLTYQAFENGRAVFEAQPGVFDFESTP